MSEEGSHQPLESVVGKGGKEKEEKEKAIGAPVQKKGLVATMSFTRDAEEGRQELMLQEKEREKEKQHKKSSGRSAAEKEERKRRRALEKEERHREKAKEKEREKERHKKTKEKEKHSVDGCNDGEHWAWKVEEASTGKKGTESTRHSVNLESGHYHLLLVKSDTVTGVRKRLRATMTVTSIPPPVGEGREGVESSPLPPHYHEQYEVEFGGLGHSKKQHLDINVPSHVPHARLDIAVANAPSAPDLLPGKYSVYLSERDRPCLQASKKKRKSGMPVLSMFNSFLSPSSHPEPERDLQASHSTGTAPAPGKDLFRLESVLLQGRQSWTFTLAEGYYYAGAKHAGSGSGSIKASLKLTNELGIIISQAGSLEMQKGSEPWRQYFHVARRHAPATLHLKVTAPLSGVKTSVKLKELPNPYSIEELRRKTVKARMYISMGLALVIALSYLFDIVMTLLRASVPLLGMSVRFLLLLILIPFCIVNQHDLKDFLAGKWEELKRFVDWLLKIEGTDTNALQKVALLRERQVLKKKEEKLKKQKQNEL